MAKKQRKSANDKPQSFPRPRPSQQSVANKSSSNVPRMPKQSTGHDAPSIRLASTTSQPFSSSSSSQISYHAIPPPASLNSGSPPFESLNIIGFQTSYNIDTPILNPIEPSISLPVLAETLGTDTRFSSEMNIGT